MERNLYNTWLLSYKRFPFIYFPTRIPQIIDRAFGSKEISLKFLNNISPYLNGESAMVVLSGSLAFGTSFNKTGPSFGIPPDIGRISDLDIGICDECLFSALPNSEKIKKPSLLGNRFELIGQISYGIWKNTNDIGTIYLKKYMENRAFRGIADAVEELYTNTGRVPEIAFLNGERALKLYGQPSIVMIYKRKIVI